MISQSIAHGQLEINVLFTYLLEIMMTINLDKLIRFFFLSTLFLYPFIFFNHTLFLIPQFLFSILLLSSKKIRSEQVSLSPLSVIAFIFIIFISIAPFFINEFHEEKSGLLFPVKLAINFFTIAAIILAKKSFIQEKDIEVMKKFRTIFLLLSLSAYLFVSSSAQITTTIFLFLKKSNSTLLYQLAEPLNYLFLTKNITAAFMASLFAYYLFLCTYFKRNVLFRDWVLFWLLIALFFSRQSLITYLALVGSYYFFYANLTKKMIGFVAVLVCALLICLTFFDFSNTNDGASERVQLYQMFFKNINQFFFFGLGQEGMDLSIKNEGILIDNYHMFFMNQIGAFGIFHTVAFNSFLILTLFYVPRDYKKYTIFLVVAYWSNVLFQTFGYEFQNLWLAMVIISFGYKLQDKNKFNVECKASISQ